MRSEDQRGNPRVPSNCYPPGVSTVQEKMRNYGTSEKKEILPIREQKKKKQKQNKTKKIEKNRKEKNRERKK